RSNRAHAVPFGEHHRVILYDCDRETGHIPVFHCFRDVSIEVAEWPLRAQRRAGRGDGEDDRRAARSRTRCSEAEMGTPAYGTVRQLGHEYTKVGWRLMRLRTQPYATSRKTGRSGTGALDSRT